MSHIKTLEELMNADVRNVADIKNAMKMDNDNYSIDDIKEPTFRDTSLL
jgi:hypothetical protein